MSLFLDINNNYIFGGEFEFSAIFFLLMTLIISTFIYLKMIESNVPVSKRHLSLLMLLAWSGSIFTTLAGLLGEGPYDYIALHSILFSMIDDGLRGIYSVAIIYGMILITPRQHRKYPAYLLLMFLLMSAVIHFYMHQTHYFRCCFPPHGIQYGKNVPCKQCVL